MAACPMAWAKWLLPVPGGPRNSASSRRAIKPAVARSKTRLRFIFLLKAKSKLSRVFWESRNCACFFRRSSKRSPRRASSSETRQESKSMGASGSAWAWRRRVSSTAAIPPRRSCLRHDRVQSDSFLYLLGSVINQVAVLHQLADQRIHLLQTEWGLGVALQIAADKAVLLHSHLQRSGAGFIDRRCSVLLGQRENAQDAAHAYFAFLAMDGIAERADMESGSTRSPQQLRGAQWRPLGAVLGLDAIPASLLAQVFAQQLPGLGIQQADIQVIPLHPDLAPDPARRRAVVSGFDLDAAVQMHDAFAVLVIAEWFQREWKQRGFLFGKHGGHLPLGRAVDAGVGPALFPMIEVGLGFFHTLEAQAFQRCSLRMTNAGFDLTFAIGILNAARHSYRAVVRQDIAIKRIQRGIVHVGNEYALAQIVEYDDARGATQPAKSSFVQLGPDAR